jgi:small subunit ribosomal protein S6e
VLCHPGPKRASRICKVFNLSKEDDVCQCTVRKPLNKERKKHRTSLAQWIMPEILATPEKNRRIMV